MTGDWMTESKEGLTVFTEFFGTSPKVRIIDYLLDNPISSYTKKEISEGAKISWASLFNHWEMLERMKVVKEVRKVGRIRLYQLNDSEPLVQHLKKLDFILMKMGADEAEEEYLMKVKAKAGAKSRGARGASNPS